MPRADDLRGELTVAELQAGDAQSAARVAALLNGELGEGLYGAEGLLMDAADPAATLVVAEASGLIGAAVSRVLRPADLGYYERFGGEGRRLSIGLSGSLEALAVEPAFRRRGVGRLLAQASLSWMRAQGCDLLVTLAWRSGRGCLPAPLSTAGLSRRPHSRPLLSRGEPPRRLVVSRLRTRMQVRRNSLHAPTVSRLTLTL